MPIEPRKFAQFRRQQQDARPAGQDGIDIGAARPKLLDAGVAQRADRIITMGCDVEGVARIDEDWGLPDPKGQPVGVVRAIRDLTKTKVRALVEDLNLR